MKIWSWGLLVSLGFVAGCGQMGQTSDPDVGHGEVLSKEGKKFVWGPAAPEAPLTPAPEPQLPDQPGSPMSPGDGPKSTDKLIPTTSAAEPK